jgi:transposase
MGATGRAIPVSERSFAHVLDGGGKRRAWLRGRQNVHKRYLIHVAGFNLGILMRAMFGQGTHRGGRERQKRAFVLHTIRFYAADRRYLGRRR